MIRIIATSVISPEKVDEAIAIYTELVQLTREEQGCAQYTLVQSIEEPNHLTILEAWESKEALEAHSASEHMARIALQLGPLCMAPPSMIVTKELV